MEITWSAIGKVLVAGIATYVLLPAALIARDYILWKLINAYVLNNKLREEVRRYARLAENWNKKFSGKREFSGSSDDDFLNFLDASQKAQEEIQKVKLYIDRNSRFLTWLLKHYKQDAINPIGEWKKQAKEELEKRQQHTS